MEQKGFNLIIDNVSEQVKIRNKTKTILSNLSLSIERGEFIAIVGCSGAGKTTLMNILSGYSRPSKGKVYVEGLDILKEEEYFKGKIAYVPQEEILDQTLTLYKSLEYSLKLRIKNISKEESKKTISHILKILELS
ncbi:MAG: ATP-binding cassette domain-containing protein, partial [Bacilli bacterium]|nr:ATP-binding cassette domain-containing protein [Bacilli bacterium]